MLLVSASGGRDWASRVGPERTIQAQSLTAVDGSGRSLADAVGTAAGATLGSGSFGHLFVYRHHGAEVAVKELRVGADESSIGMSPSTGIMCFRLVPFCTGCAP